MFNNTVSYDSIWKGRLAWIVEYVFFLQLNNEFRDEILSHLDRENYLYCKHNKKKYIKCVVTL